MLCDQTRIELKNGGVLSRMERWFYKGKLLEVDGEVDNSFIYAGLLLCSSRLSFNQMVNELCVKGKRIFTAILSS